MTPVLAHLRRCASCFPCEAYEAYEAYELGPPQEPLTLALAMTETFTLAAAVTDAFAATPAQAMALPLALATPETTAWPVVTSLPAAWTASGPCTCSASMMAGMFVCTVVTRAVMLALAVPEHCSVTAGGVHIAVRFAWPEQLPWQLTSELHLAGVMVPSHLGAVTATLQPPLQVAMPLQLMPPIAVILQLPVHLPLQVPSQ